MLRFKQLDPRALLPKRGSVLAAGLDVCSIEELKIEPKQRTMARTGLAVAIPPGFYGRVAPRSGLAAKNGLDVLAGVIDSDYRGEVKVPLINLGKQSFTIERGTRIAQMLVLPVPKVNLVEVDELDETARGKGGFGHTGH